MGEARNDHLRYEYSQLHEAPLLLTLPFELLEKILDEVAFNSIGGLQSFSQSSRITQSLSRPYFYKPREVKFNELRISPDHSLPVILTVREKDHNKTLHLVRPRIGYSYMHPRHPPPSTTIQSLLGSHAPYTAIEYTPPAYHPFLLTPSALDVLNSSCPDTTSITLGLAEIVAYATAATMTALPHGLSASLSTHDLQTAQNTLAAISRFPNLTTLTLHFTLSTPTLLYLHTAHGPPLAHALLTRLNHPTLHTLNLHLSVPTYALFGPTRNPAPHRTLSTVTTCSLPSKITPTSPSTATTQPTLTTTHPIFTQILDLKSLSDSLYPPPPNDQIRYRRHLLPFPFCFLCYLRPRQCLIGWHHTTGPTTWKHLHSSWPDPSPTRLFLVRARVLPPLVVWGAGKRVWRGGKRVGLWCVNPKRALRRAVGADVER